MILGLNPGALMFWLNLLGIILIAGSAAAFRRVTWIMGVSIVMNIFAALLIWTMQGACVLPQPSIVEYHQGMNICPGQAAKVIINVPVPAPDQRI